MSSKIFEDLGFSAAEAAALNLKADLHSKIVKRAEQHSQKALETILDESQPRISDLLRGKMSKFSLEKLVFYAERLGLHTQIKTTEEKKKPSRAHKAAAGMLLLL
jgi:predicted XRE-type DNA-binding protein